MQAAYAGEKSTYDSGYDYGGGEAGIPHTEDRYLDQLEEGRSFHTDEFMLGYDDGYGAYFNSQNKGIDGSSNLSYQDKFKVIVTFIETKIL